MCSLSCAMCCHRGKEAWITVLHELLNNELNGDILDNDSPSKYLYHNTLDWMKPYMMYIK